MNIENIRLNSYKTRAIYSQAKKIDCGSFYLIFVSGFQPPKDNNHKVITDDVGEQTKLVFKDISKILNQAGASLNDVVKAVIYLTDMKDFNIVSPIREKYFKDSNPVSTIIEINRMTREGAKIEIEVTAMINKKGK